MISKQDVSKIPNLTNGYYGLVPLMFQDWTDSRLSWDTSLYGNITTITINWGWRPQFFIGNRYEIKQKMEIKT